jgi:hypothetical protein
MNTPALCVRDACSSDGVPTIEGCTMKRITPGVIRRGHRCKKQDLTPSATETIVDGPNAGRTATIDANGLFQFAAMQPDSSTIRTRAAEDVDLSQPITRIANQSTADRAGVSVVTKRRMNLSAAAARRLPAIGTFRSAGALGVWST